VDSRTKPHMGYFTRLEATEPFWGPLYADIGLFVATFKQDIQNLAFILHGIGEVTDFCTNFQKSFVVLMS
jgi:23S rRNA maturation-related 3'-5' exoribonuclease YhaM